MSRLVHLRVRPCLVRKATYLLYAYSSIDPFVLYSWLFAFDLLFNRLFVLFVLFLCLFTLFAHSG
ncbi:hypothetical protein F5Y17DRAFT_435715 [Xylariaceae sp. FL0594]|nr:hypothetical protein F5Y17DRAFT_435715 [Xylariaceae sp. FL0594]